MEETDMAGQRDRPERTGAQGSGSAGRRPLGGQALGVLLSLGGTPAGLRGCIEASRKGNVLRREQRVQKP